MTTSLDPNETFEFDNQPADTVADPVIPDEKPEQEKKIELVAKTDQPKEHLPATQKNEKMLADPKTGILRGGSLEEQYRLAKFFAASGVFPKSFRTPESCLALLQYCYEQGLKPVSASRNLCRINDTISAWGELPLSKVLESGQCLQIIETVFDRDGKEICRDNNNLGVEVYGAETISIRRVPNRTVTTCFTMDDAKKAGLLSKDCWKGYPKRMLQMRARGQNLKDNFPDVLGGMSIAEYDFNTLPEENSDAITVSHRPVESSLNDRFGKESGKIENPLADLRS